MNTKVRARRREMCKIFREFLRFLSRLMASLSSVLQFHPNHSPILLHRAQIPNFFLLLPLPKNSMPRFVRVNDESPRVRPFSFFSFISDTRYRYSIFPMNGNPDGRGSFSRHVQHRKMIEFYTRVYQIRATQHV